MFDALAHPKNEYDDDDLEGKMGLPPRLHLVPLVGDEVGPPHGHGHLLGGLIREVSSGSLKMAF